MENLKIVKRGRWGFLEGPIDIKLDKQLYKILAYQKEGAQFMANPAWAWVRFYSRKKHRFPFGLIDMVIPVLNKWEDYSGQHYELIPDKPLLTVDGVREYKEMGILRPYQVDAVNALIRYGGGIVAIATAGGKSLVGIEFLKHIVYKKTLIVVPTIDLREQWIEDVKKYQLHDVLVTTYQSIKKDEVKKLLAFDIVIYDECHHTPAKTLYYLAMNCHNARVVGFTATPYRNDKSDMKIFAALGSIIYRAKISELTELGFLCDAEVRLLDVKETPKILMWDTYNEVYVTAIVNNDSRNKTAISKAKEHSKTGTVIMLIDRIEHGEKLLKDYDWQGYRVIFVHGKSKDRKAIFKDINDGKYDIVIASKIYNEGVNFPRLQTLILACGGKSSVKIVQQVGRILRLFPEKDKAIIYDFMDDVKYLKKHFKERLKIYKDNGFKVTFWGDQTTLKVFENAMATVDSEVDDEWE